MATLRPSQRGRRVPPLQQRSSTMQDSLPPARRRSSVAALSGSEADDAEALDLLSLQATATSSSSQYQYSTLSPSSTSSSGSASQGQIWPASGTSAAAAARTRHYDTNAKSFLTGMQFYSPSAHSASQHQQQPERPTVVLTNASGSSFGSGASGSTSSSASSSNGHLRSKSANTSKISLNSLDNPAGDDEGEPAKLPRRNRTTRRQVQLSPTPTTQTTSKGRMNIEISDADVARVANLVIHLRDSRAVSSSSAKKRQKIALDQSDSIEPSPATERRVLKTKTWLELHAAYISQSQVAQHHSALVNHRGVDGVYNPLQIIRNRLVRKALNHSLDMQPVAIVTPASTAYNSNPARPIIWEVDVNEMFADWGWRERNRTLMRDRSNRLLYEPMLRDEDARRHGHKRSDTAEDEEYSGSDLSGDEESDEDAKGGRLHGRLRRHRHHRHDGASRRRVVKILPDFGLTREIEYQLTKRQMKAAASQMEKGARRRRVANEEDEDDEAYDSYESSSGESYTSSDTDSDDASSQAYSEGAVSDAVFEEAVHSSGASSTNRKLGFRKGHHHHRLHRRGRRRASEAGQFSPSGSRSASPVKSRPGSPGSKKTTPVSAEPLVSPDGLLAVPSLGLSSAGGAGGSSGHVSDGGVSIRKSKKSKSPSRRPRSFHRSHSRSSSSTTADLSLSNSTTRSTNGRQDQKLLSPQYRDSNVSKVVFSPAHGSTATVSTPLLSPASGNDLHPLTRIRPESDVEDPAGETSADGGASTPALSSRAEGARAGLAELVQELRWLDAQFAVQGRRAAVVCTVYQRSISRLADTSAVGKSSEGKREEDSAAVDDDDEDDSESIPALRNSFETVTSHFKDVTLTASKAALSTLSSRADALTSAFSTSFRSRFDFAISASDRLSAEINTTLSLQVRRLGEELEYVEKEGASSRRRAYMKNELKQVGFVVLDKAVTGVLWMVWGVVMVLRVLRSVVRAALYVLRIIIWC
ncbi:hypothetical protein BZA70DRAFT_31530 [Myxozyma melibiosi]|uniref:Uncharacterized protein n=1 Tax=Myxozyma melibiosi TaxID=54550 RepID=A0ABR1FDQ1_9ASCO